MERRWTGVLVVVLALLAVAVFPKVTGRSVGGAAQATPVPAPPSVGDCRLEPGKELGSDGFAVEYVTSELAPCQGRRFGEVVAVLQDGRRAPSRSAVSGSSGSVVIDDPNRLACTDAVWQYLGVSVAAGHTPLLADHWSPVAFAGASPIGPSERQKASGQNWVACVLRVADTYGVSVSYTASTRNSYRTGNVPTAFAVCLDSVDLLAGSAGTCAAPHRVEVFGATNTGRGGLTQALLDRSCRALVVQLTGLVEPTVGAALQVTALTTHGFSEPVTGLGSATDQSGFAACAVIAPENHQLGASLLGLGTRPVPWVK